MKVIEVNMERRRNEWAEKREIPEKTRRPTASSSTSEWYILPDLCRGSLEKNPRWSTKIDWHSTKVQMLRSLFGMNILEEGATLHVTTLRRFPGPRPARVCEAQYGKVVTDNPKSARIFTENGKKGGGTASRVHLFRGLTLRMEGSEEQTKAWACCSPGDEVFVESLSLRIKFPGARQSVHERTVRVTQTIRPIVWNVLVPSSVTSRIFACGNRAGRYHWPTDFLSDPPFFPYHHSIAVSYSPLFTLISSQDLDWVRILASHLGEPGSIPGGVIPGFSHVGIEPGGATGSTGFLGISSFRRPCIPVMLQTHLASPSFHSLFIYRWVRNQNGSNPVSSKKRCFTLAASHLARKSGKGQQLYDSGGSKTKDSLYEEA
ncbi:hypothetical protein PR048_006625 [Dryococelus australis]|uniref:Uncharacterized protein n=1 Tax=Dryococelus australis TaxID=614101 RepID=A0ABQ9IBG5_9NEOP|nr:hypothetical protein PR048_006625 [Dryococelus australis]